MGGGRVTASMPHKEILKASTGQSPALRRFIKIQVKGGLLYLAGLALLVVTHSDP